MLENRSFDHMLGFLKRSNADIDGCLPGDPRCSCPVDPAAPPGGARVAVDDGALYIADADPDHSVHGTTYDLYGVASPPGPPWPTDAPMSGFVRNYEGRVGGGKGGHIMKCFAPSHVPALSALAQDFALFDRWFPSVPGPTMPNRVFAMSGTTRGMATNDDIRIGLGFRQTSIFQLIDEAAAAQPERQAELDWGIYFQEVPSMLAFDYVRAHPLRFHDMLGFQTHAAAGTLPAFSFLEPSYFESADFPASDQHPDHDVALGDALVKRVYDSVRRGPKWNSTLLLVTYDEHGGFFDHVPPPAAVPSPDGIVATDDPFDFTRLGVRIPTVAVSPWIRRGTTVHAPGTAGTAAGPAPDSEFEATSTLGTVRKLLGLGGAPFSAREAWAGTFEGLLQGDARTGGPRTDCLQELPEPPAHREVPGVPLAPYAQLGRAPVNELGRTFVNMMAHMNGVPSPLLLTRQQHNNASSSAAAAPAAMALNRERTMTEEEGAHFVVEQVNALLGRKVASVAATV